MLLLVVDDIPVMAFRATDPRPDVNALGLPGLEIGFRFETPDALLDGRSHRVSIRFRSGGVLPFLLPGGEQQIEMRFLYRPTSVSGIVDGMFGSSVRGWAFRTDERTGERTGGVTIEVRAGGVRIDQVKAGLIRNDVAEAMGCDPNCGFLYSVPTRFRDGRTFVLEFHAVPEGGQIVGSPFTGSVPTRDTIDQLHGMHAQIEALCTQMYALKDQLRQMVTADEYTIDIYDSWAARYLDCLRARVVAERRSSRYAELLPGDGPKVSIICPTFKPDLAEFVAAVESVRRQTWRNWELLIVDDGSGSKALTEIIDKLCADDPRIYALPQRKNRGISSASNAGIVAATGEYVAFFDHDDVLVDVALEVMVLAARDTGATVLYSDEDKIDQYGVLSEPHLKSDWNYRLLLSNNYVCHLLLVEAATLRAVGPLEGRYDGAQDHDLVLRLSEHVGAGAIYHVPEILYHWRKTATSTASLQSSKNYAVAAGRDAILAHVRRLGLEAEVTAPFDTTLYDVRWIFTDEPRVSILIPFKDQVETTRRCVECILAATQYENYEIVLIDNWSTNPLTGDWLGSLAGNDRIRVVRVEEKFNYSRINNLAAQTLDSDYLLFMNNDIFVEQPDWLRIMVDEALADPKVGMVGVKLIYPNQTVQHGGVVLGVGGVADHTFRYAPKDQPGYCFRAICAQDMSAATAACLLCRTDAFREVGMFDAEKLTIAFNDVDLCLKIGQAGYRIIYTPAVIAEHHESLSRGSDLLEHNLARFYAENQVMWDRWGPLIRRDPFYNPHFSRETGMFEKLSSASLDPTTAPSLVNGGMRLTRGGPPPPVTRVVPAQRLGRSKPASRRRSALLETA